jgi:hypothetical protein
MRIKAGLGRRHQHRRGKDMLALQGARVKNSGVQGIQVNGLKELRVGRHEGVSEHVK